MTVFLLKIDTFCYRKSLTGVFIAIEELYKTVPTTGSQENEIKKLVQYFLGKKWKAFLLISHHEVFYFFSFWNPSTKPPRSMIVDLLNWRCTLSLISLWARPKQFSRKRGLGGPVPHKYCPEHWVTEKQVNTVATCQLAQ